MGRLVYVPLRLMFSNANTIARRLHAVGELKDTTEGIPYFDFVLLQTKDSMPKGVDGGTQTSLAKSAPPDSKEDLLEGGYDLVSQHAGSL